MAAVLNSSSSSKDWYQDVGMFVIHPTRTFLFELGRIAKMKIHMYVFLKQTVTRCVSHSYNKVTSVLFLFFKWHGQWSRDCLAFFILFIQSIWAPDKQVKFVSLKHSFSRRFSNFYF